MELQDFKCPICGEELILISEIRRGVLDGDEIPEEDESSIIEYSCENCGWDFTLWEPLDEVKKHYPYYQNGNDDGN